MIKPERCVPSRSASSLSRGSVLSIDGPRDLDVLAIPTRELGIDLVVIDREMRVVWSNQVVVNKRLESSSRPVHCFSAQWGRGDRCPDCLPLLGFRTGEAQEGLRERGKPEEARGGSIAIEIDDDGPGVSEQAQEHIFDPFYTTRSDGTGLGLAVCNRVVAGHGGDIGVRKSDLGGACFFVQLPLPGE